MTDDWDYEKEKIAQKERSDARYAATARLGIIAATLVLLAIVGSIAYGGITAAKRDAAFKEQCMERGGVVAYHQCYYTEPQEG